MTRQRICSRTSGHALALAGVMALALLVPGGAPRADEVYTFVVKKQEEKAKSRWSLAEWLDTRDRMRMMDLWLALHSPAPYEFYIGGSYVPSGDGRYAAATGTQFMAGAYASIFGLGAERLALGAQARTTALLLLRVFGFHYQATNITLQGGFSSTAPGAGADTYRNPVAGVSMSVYLGKYFGLDGSFRRSFASSTSPSVSGNSSRAGAFIDFKFLRVFGGYAWENLPGEGNYSNVGAMLFF